MTTKFIGNDNEASSSIPFKVVDAGRDVRMGLTANSMTELIERVRLKFDIDEELAIKIVLEQDGTEIDDNDYFITLEPDTSLMVLQEHERWTPYKSMMSLGLALEPHSEEDILDRVNASNAFGMGLGLGCGSGSTPSSPVEELVWRLHQDLSLFPWLTPKELDTIARMDTEEMKKNIPDVRFLEFLQDLSERYLQDKGGLRDVHTILKSSSSTGSGSGSVSGSGSGSGSSGSGYSSSGGGSASVSPSGTNANGSGGISAATTTTTTTVLHDPIKLIRMYSKSNHYLYNHNPKNIQYCHQNGRDVVHLSGGEKPPLHVEPKAFRSQ